MARRWDTKKGRSTSVNPGLSAEGVAQAERLRDRLAATGEIRGDVLIFSHLAQVRETAEIIAPALGLPVVIDEQYEEFRLGECEGLSDEEIIRALPPETLEALARQLKTNGPAPKPQ